MQDLKRKKYVIFLTRLFVIFEVDCVFFCREKTHVVVVC